jgi:hypothetical protein
VRLIPRLIKDERIRFRAYELYLERGQAQGHDVDDWRQAEAEIPETTQKTAAARAEALRRGFVSPAECRAKITCFARTSLISHYIGSKPWSAG